MIDCDIHPNLKSPKALHPYLSERWREHRDTPWPKLLDYWGLPNLQVINRDVHVEKCADEAGWRRERAGDAVKI